MVTEIQLFESPDLTQIFVCGVR